MHVAILADTHIPERADEIPQSFRDRIREADHTIHAGDFTSIDVVEDVRSLANELTAVHGNVDPADIGLPPIEAVDLGGVTFVVTHCTVHQPDGWSDHLAETTREHATEPMVGVGAHIHQVVDTTHDGVRLLNPGSATAAPAERKTMLTVDVADGDLNVTVHEAD